MCGTHHDHAPDRPATRIWRPRMRMTAAKRHLRQTLRRQHRATRPRRAEGSRRRDRGSRRRTIRLGRDARRHHDKVVDTDRHQPRLRRSPSLLPCHRSRLGACGSLPPCCPSSASRRVPRPLRIGQRMLGVDQALVGRGRQSPAGRQGTRTSVVYTRADGNREGTVDHLRGGGGLRLASTPGRGATGADSRSLYSCDGCRHRVAVRRRAAGPVLGSRPPLCGCRGVHRGHDRRGCAGPSGPCPHRKGHLVLPLAVPPPEVRSRVGR